MLAKRVERLEALPQRIDRLEGLPARVGDLATEFGYHRSGIDRQIKGSVKDAVEEELKPFAAQLRKLDATADTVGKAHEILLKQEMRAEIKAEKQADEDAAVARKDASRVRRNTALTIIAPIIIALIGTLTAMIASRGVHQDPPIVHQSP
jgi:hypothetical protein